MIDSSWLLSLDPKDIKFFLSTLDTTMMNYNDLMRPSATSGGRGQRLTLRLYFGIYPRQNKLNVSLFEVDWQYIKCISLKKYKLWPLGGALYREINFRSYSNCINKARWC